MKTFEQNVLERKQESGNSNIEVDVTVDAERKRSIERDISCEIGEIWTGQRRNNLNSIEQCTKTQEEVKQNNARIKKVIEVLEYSNKKGGVRRKGTKNQETN